MTAETLTNPSVRAGLYSRLRRRNRFIGVLRILVPLFGLVLLAFLISQIIIANLARDYGVSGIHLDRDRLVIETPRYEGVTEGGTLYRVIAKTASALISRTDLIELGDATLELIRPDGVSFTATADRALYDLIGQTVEIPEVADVVDSRMTHAILYNSFVDWSAQTINARSGADITFSDGTKLVAQSLIMYGAENRWDMTGVTLDTPGTEEMQ